MKINKKTKQHIILKQQNPAFVLKSFMVSKRIQKGLDDGDKQEDLANVEARVYEQNQGTKQYSALRSNISSQQNIRAR